MEKERVAGECQVVYDTSIAAVHRDGERGLIWRDADGELRFMDFAQCARNFAWEHPGSSRRCVGARNGCEEYFLFYTGGMKTKVIFREGYVPGLFGRRPLTGSRKERFRLLQKMVAEAGYTTFDLT